MILIDAYWLWLSLVDADWLWFMLIDAATADAKVDTDDADAEASSYTVIFSHRKMSAVARE